ncbi:hypothetical protein GpartN1_g5658.t1 [Galdieria partita]|uniref:Uncharacterized protein n=1 Tax=Galdieria partita TaxID=83374 RepID=A0A9C7USP1_9RHOD|nr:hypothetical protein GpartN1_g5658.t1 [Galdieria partita]
MNESGQPEDMDDESQRLLSSIEAKRKGDPVSYFQFLHQLGTTQGELLSYKIEAITKNATKIQSDLDELVFQCLDFDWLANASSETALTSFTNFVLTVTSLHVNYVEPVIASLTKTVVCKDFSQGQSSALEEQALKEKEYLSGRSSQRANELLSRLLQLLQIVVDCYPTSSHIVYRSIHIHAPHKLRSMADQRTFIYGALQLSKIFPDIRQAVVFLIVEKLVEVDSEASQILRKGRFPLIPETSPVEEVETKEIADMVNKLDKIMEQVLLFIHHLDSCSETQSYLSYFMDSFVSRVLPLLYLRFTPFLFCIIYGSSAEKTQELLWQLWYIFTNGKNFEETRIFSVKYCSFVLSHLRVVKRETMIGWLSMAVSWLHEYLEQYEQMNSCLFQTEEEDILISDSWRSDSESLDGAWLAEENLPRDPLSSSKKTNLYSMELAHRLFYSTLDAVICVLLNRGHSLLSSEQNLRKPCLQGNLIEKFRSFRFARILRSTLCPLWFIPREQGRRFIYWAFSLRLFDCRDLLDAIYDRTTSDCCREEECCLSMIPFDVLENCGKWLSELVRKPDDFLDDDDFSDDE